MTVNSLVEPARAIVGPRRVEPPTIRARFQHRSDRQATLREVVAAARRVFNIAAEPAWGLMAERAWDTAIWVADPGAAARVLGWRAITSLHEGLRQLRVWLREHPELAARHGVAD
jgi:nucleoside-diphosphate-sugar epimerase